MVATCRPPAPRLSFAFSSSSFCFCAFICAAVRAAFAPRAFAPLTPE